MGGIILNDFPLTSLADWGLPNPFKFQPAQQKVDSPIKIGFGLTGNIVEKVFLAQKHV